MQEKSKIIIAGVVGAAAGALVVMFILTTQGNSRTVPTGGAHMMSDGSTMQGMDMGTDMDAMTQALVGKEGDAFDKVFLSEMVVHHQGAVAMAQMALTNAKHQEIRDLAKNIIAAQNTEIKSMQSWQKEWYTTSAQ